MSINPEPPDQTLYSYRFGEVEFDAARMTLRVAGLPVEIEPRALDVLAYLLRHAGEAVTKDELLREVWAGRPTVEKVLPNAILKLRRALGEGHANLIATLPRIGYRLDANVSRIATGRAPNSPLQLAVGMIVPGRPSFVLQRQLGRSSHNEVWLAEHGKTRERRVYKFASDGERLRMLKREVTLLRILRDSLDDHAGFVELIDWNFQTPPYLIELSWGGENLAEWSRRHLAGLDTDARIALFLQIADAVTAAHSVGVLHKDIKPANILVDGDDDGDSAAPRVRLADFGSSGVFDSGVLDGLGITQLGMTIEDHSSSQGTPLYLAPELVTGQAATVKSDLYSLGIVLYQLLAGSLSRPMASGWEQHIADPLLQDDLRRTIDGDPARRLGSVAELAARLRDLPARRNAAAEQAQARRQAQADRESLARTRARRPVIAALVATLAIAGTVALVLQQSAMRARDAARAELERANAISRFLNDDLISRGNPLVSAKGADATLKDVLLAASERLGETFKGQPRAEQTVRANLAVLLNTIELFDDAETQARQAIALAGQQPGNHDPATRSARAALIRILARKGQLADADQELALLQADVGDSDKAHDRQQLAAARSTVLIARGELATAAGELRRAIAATDALGYPATTQRDSLQLDLIAVLANGPEPAQALAETQALIADLDQRDGDHSLLVAMALTASARAHDPDYAANEAALMQAQPVIAEKLGEQHSRYLQLLGELVSLSFRQQNWPEAIARAQALHSQVLAKFGDKHPMSWVTLTTLGRCRYENGDFAAAGDDLRRSRQHLSTLSGDRSAHTQEATLYLAANELALGRIAQADALIAELDSAALEAGRASGLWAATITVLRARMLAQRGDSEAAANLLAPALDALREAGELDRPARLFRDLDAIASVPAHAPPARDQD